MQLHKLPTLRIRKRRRIGRGGKRGTYSGRGLKGQKSRSGRRIRPAQRDLIIQTPKLRGFRNKPLREKPLVLDLDDLRSFSGIVDRAALQKSGLIGKRETRNVKILGTGTLGAPLTVKGIAVSQAAREKIEKAGGHIE